MKYVTKIEFDVFKVWGVSHILFLSINAQSHDMTQSDIHAIYPFDIDSNDSGSNDPNHDTPTILYIAHVPPSHTYVMKMNLPPPRNFTRNHMSTKILQFAYSYYLPLYASFISNIQNLSEPESYIEKFFSDLIWQNVMVKELTTLPHNYTSDLIPLLPKKHMNSYYWIYIRLQPSMASYLNGSAQMC